MRRTQGTMNLISEIERYQKAFPDKNDQFCLFELLKDSMITDMRQYPNSKLNVYPVEEYTNGAWTGDTSKIYFFHANHVIGKQAKIDLLKRFNQWFIQ